MQLAVRAGAGRLRAMHACLVPVQARGEVDARRQRLAKLRGTPGIREERVSEAERELWDAQQRAEVAKEVYEVGWAGWVVRAPNHAGHA